MTRTDHTTDPDPAAGLATGEIAAKVRKLLAKAESTSSVEEADAFSRKAAELIAAHRLDPRRLFETADDPLCTIEIGLGRGPYVRARLSLVAAVARASACPVVFRRAETETVAMVAGHRSDLDTVEMLYTSLHAQAAARLAFERGHDAVSTRRWRRSFLFGYAQQVSDMLAETTRCAEEHHRHENSTLLPALLDREERVREYAIGVWGRTSRARPPARADPLGYLAGQHAAASADLGRSPLGERRALGAGG